MIVTGYFLLMEIWLIAASDGVLPMPNYLAYLALAVLLFYAAIELWSHVLPDEASHGKGRSH